MPCACPNAFAPPTSTSTACLSDTFIRAAAGPRRAPVRHDQRRLWHTARRASRRIDPVTLYPQDAMTAVGTLTAGTPEIRLTSGVGDQIAGEVGLNIAQ
jgi:hypothetical protein